MEKIRVPINKVVISIVTVSTKNENSEYSINCAEIETVTKKKTVSEKFIDKVVNSYCVDNDVTLVEIKDVSVERVTAEIPPTEIIKYISE